METITRERHLQAMVVIHHGGDAIKSVPIKFVLIDPPSRV